MRCSLFLNISTFTCKMNDMYGECMLTNVLSAHIINNDYGFGTRTRKSIPREVFQRIMHFQTKTQGSKAQGDITCTECMVNFSRRHSALVLQPSHGCNKGFSIPLFWQS